MNKQKLISTIKQEFMLKRYRAQEKCDEFIASLRQNKEFDNLYSTYLSLQFQQMKQDYEQNKHILNQEIELIKNKMQNFLTKNNIDKSKLEPQYQCKVCNDTGVFNGKICQCLLNELNLKLSKKACSQSIFKDFSKLNYNIMNENDIKASEWLKMWCSRYPNVTKTNVNIIGGAGTGKTFLLECVASEMLNKNVVVCYKTAFEVNELARLYHIGKSFDFGDCLNSDVLLIDDLGTEPVLKNVTKEYFYNLINVRQINNRPTFITTNLSLDNILDRYDDRIFSRLGNKNLAINIQLTSQDKRL